MNTHRLNDQLQDDLHACSAPFYETAREGSVFWTARFQAAENGKENALLFVEAANVKGTTGYTPNELAAENESQRSLIQLQGKTTECLNDLLHESLKHIKELGHIIRHLDEENIHNEYWTLDGEYTSFTNDIEGQITGKNNPASAGALFKDYIEISAEKEILSERISTLENQLRFMLNVAKAKSDHTARKIELRFETGTLLTWIRNSEAALNK